MNTQKTYIFPTIPKSADPEIVRYLEELQKVVQDIMYDVYKDFVFPTASLSATETPKTGAWYFANSKIYVYNGTSWIATGALT